MKYELPQKGSGYYPPVILTLNGIADDMAFNAAHGLMHPVDVFLTTFNDSIESALRLTRRVNSIVSSKVENPSFKIEDIDDIRVDIFNFLFFSANLIESCQSIIKSLFEKDSKLATKAVREFNGLTTEYRGHVLKIINYIKHKHRRIRPITTTWGNQIIIGYYIEGVVEKNVIGPDPDIHLNADTAISLNRDIPYHIFNYYFICSCLNTIIKKYIKHIKISPIIPEESKILQLLQEVNKIPSNYFPDEIFKNSVTISIRGQSTEKILLEYPGKEKAKNRNQQAMDISITSTIGIRSRSLKLPYFIAQP